ncbi:MAG: endonuclease/exonuclease/phosphatase family protein, partial [Candidatus Binatia bacterium]
MIAPAVPLRTLRIATINLWNRSEPYAARMLHAGQCLSRLAPDVIGLQEAFAGGGRNQAGELGAREAYHVLWHPAGAIDGGTIGNAVLSRYPIRGGAVRRLPHADGAIGRIVVRADIDLPEGELHFFCTHLSYRADESYKREEQVVAVNGFVREATRELPRILVGDFNADPESTEIRFLTGKATIGGRSAYYQDSAAIVGAAVPT